MPDASAALPPSFSTDAQRRARLADLFWAGSGAWVWTLVLLLVPPTIFGGPDFVRYFDPYLGYLRTSILHGEIPWWNPYASLGRPFAADLQSGTFYPTNYLSVVFGLRWGWIIATLAHGTMGMFGFIRLAGWCGSSRVAARAGAFVFLFSAPLLARMQAGTVNYAYSWCYLPLGLWLAGRLAVTPSRRVWAGLATVWGLQFLSSHPQPLWLSLLGIGTFVTGMLACPPWQLAWRKWWRAAAAMATALACGMALCGFVLVPFLELISQSNRATPTLAYSAKFVMTAEHWMSLVAPPSAAFLVNWEYNLYAGAIVLLGGFVGLTRWRDPATRGLILMMAVGAVIAVGDATPLFAILFKTLPGLASFRIPARAGVLVMFGLLLAATMLAGRAPAPGPRYARTLLVGGLLFAAVTGAFALRFMPGGAGTMRWLVTQWAMIFAAGAGWWLWFNPASPAPQAWWRRATLPAVLALELYLGVPDFARLNVDTREFPVEALVVSAIHAKHLDQTPAPARVCLPPELMRENSGMIQRYATITGFESLSLGRTWNYLHRAAGLDPHYGFNSNPLREVYDRANRMGSLNLSVWLPPDGSSLVITPAADPRAYLVTRATVVADADDATARMLAGHPFHQDALIETPLATGLLGGGPADGASVRITSFTANSLEISVDSPVTGMLVVAEAWYPGWRAEIGGRTLDCLPVNSWMRGVPVPAGHSTVRMYFHPQGFALGCIFSVGAALVLIWATFSRRPGAGANYGGEIPVA